VKSKQEIQKLVEAAENEGRALIETWDRPLRGALITRDDSYLNDIKPEERRLFEYARVKVGRVVTSFLQLQSIITDTYKCLKMANRYPWHGTAISKSDHFYFVWFNFTNQCYLFSTRTKNFYNRLNAANRALGFEAIDSGEKIKSSNVVLREYIKHRGQHVHEWHLSHESYFNFEQLEVLNKLSDDYAQDLCWEYLDTKYEISNHILKALEFMTDAFLNAQPNPRLQVANLTDRLSRLQQLFSITKTTSTTVN